MARSHPSQKVVIVTGCGSGLGLAIASHLHRFTQHRLVITAHGPSLKAVQELFAESDRTMVRELDITVSNHIHPLLNEVCNRWGGIDVLVNSASVFFQSVIEHMDEDIEELQMRTNYLGPMALIKSVLPLMREQRRGHIINISSVNGMLLMPTMASYGASKYALEGASEALWYEGRPYGIKVTLVQPGFMSPQAAPNMILSDKAKISTCLQGPHSEFYDSMELFLERWMRKSVITPERVAQKIAQLINRANPPMRLSANRNLLMYGVLRRLLPGSLFQRLILKMMPESKNWGQRKSLRRSS